MMMGENLSKYLQNARKHAKIMTYINNYRLVKPTNV